MIIALYDEQERRSAELATDRGGSRFEASSACAPRMEAHRVAFESNPTPAAGMGGLSMFTRPSLFQLAVVLLSIWPAAVHCADATAGPSAGKLRASADQAFANGDLDNAVKFLSQAIQLEPENEKNHYKRYRAYLRGKRYREALQDLSMSIQLDPDNAQKIQQRAKLYKMMGRCTDAVDDFGRLQKLQAPLDGMEEARNCMFSLDQAEKLMAVGHWHEARHHLEQAAAVTEAAPDLMYKKAVCAFELRDFYGVAADTGRAIKLDSGNLLALELRAKAYYHLGEYDMAQTHYREALKFDPEHKGCKDGYRQLKKKLKSVEKGQAALDRGQAQEAIEYFHDAIKVDPAHAVFNGPVLVKVARAHLHLKETAKAKETAEKALEHDGRLVEGYLVLSDVLQAMDDFEEAVRVLRRGHEALPEEKRLEEAIQKAEIALKQSKEVNYYKVLGVDRRADTSEIKKAYRTLAKKYHPDKIQDSTPEEKEKAEKEFLKVAEAYEVLSNDDLRARYDRGEDVGSNRQGMQQQGHNPFGFGFPGAGGQQHFTFHFRH